MSFRVLFSALLLLVLPTLLAAESVPILGRVVGPDGEPQARAAVRLEPIPTGYERARLRIDGQAGPKPVATTRTDAKGDFELSAPEIGMWKVVVEAPDHLAMEYRLIPLIDPRRLPKVELTPAADLEVRLVDAEGKPHPGRIGAFSPQSRGGNWRPQLRLTTAGEDGLAHLPIGAGETLRMQVLAAGFPLRNLEVEDRRSVRVELDAGVAVTVRLTQRDRQPTAEVLAFQGNGLVPLGLSDAEGQLPLVLDTGDVGAIHFETADSWHATFEIDFDSADPDKIGQGVEELRLAPPLALQGQVLNLEGRIPVAGALVWAVRGEVAITDARGRYALDLGVFKPSTIQAAASGYQHSYSERRPDDRGPTIALPPAATLSGRVVDPQGEPIAGATLEVRVIPHTGAPHTRIRDYWIGRSSPGGTFRVPGLSPGASYRLRAEKKGYAEGTVEVPALESFESRSGIELVLEPGRRGLGRVVDEDDAPVAGAEVWLEVPPPSDDMMQRIRTRSWRRDSEPEPPAAVTDPEGRFEITDLGVGRYHLTVRAAGFAPARAPGLRVAEAAAETDFGTVTLIAGATVEGRVTETGGRPIPGAAVSIHMNRQGLTTLSGAPESLGEATTDAEGRFAVEDLLPERPVTVTIAKEGYSTEALASVKPPTEDALEVVLEPSAQLKGRVVDERGQPIARARISAMPDYRSLPMAAMSIAQRSQHSSARSDADGRYLLANVQPGKVQIFAQAPSYQRYQNSSLELKAGAENELEIVLRKGATLEGRVSDADGSPVVGASIQVEPQGGDGGRMASASGNTDADGRYRIEGAPLGPAAVAAFHHDHRRVSRNVEIEAGTNVVDLTFEPGYEVSGQVIGPDAEPKGGVTVSIQQAPTASIAHFSFSGSLPMTTSRADGTFTLSGVGAGSYQVHASHPGWAPAKSETLEIANDVSGLLLELGRGATLHGRIVGLEFDELGALTLIAYGQTASGMYQGQVDVAATYAFDHLTPGTWHIQAQVGGSGRTAMMQVEIPEGVSEVEKDLEFGAGFTLSGVVVDGSQPLVHAQITAAGSNGGMGTTATDDQGRFRLESLPAGSYQVMVMADSRLQHIEPVELAADQEIVIEIATGSLSGAVRDASTGAPVAGAGISLERLDAPPGTLESLQVTAMSQVESDSDGRFTVPRVRQGLWRVIANKAGYAPGEATAQLTGGGAGTVEIQLTPTEGISFEVVLESGFSLPAVQTVLLNPSGQPLANGQYPVFEGKVEVPSVPAGRWELVVQGGDSAATRVMVNSPGDQGRVVLPRGGHLKIEVPELEDQMMTIFTLTGPDGKPFVSTSGISLGLGQWVLQAGNTTVPNLMPGAWTFQIAHPDGRSWSGNATVTPGTTTEVSVP